MAGTEEGGCWRPPGRAHGPSRLGGQGGPAAPSAGRTACLLRAAGPSKPPAESCGASRAGPQTGCPPPSDPWGSLCSTSRAGGSPPHGGGALPLTTELSSNHRRSRRGTERCSQVPRCTAQEPLAWTTPSSARSHCRRLRKQGRKEKPAGRARADPVVCRAETLSESD